jgi:phage-related protein
MPPRVTIAERLVLLSNDDVRQAIYVLHVFRKKTRKTPKRDMTTARSRFQEVLRREALKK